MLPSKNSVVDLSPRQIQILKLFPEFYELISCKDIEKALRIDRTTVHYYLHGRGKIEGLLGMGVLKGEKGRNPALYGLTPKGVRILRAILRGGLTFNTSDFVHNGKMRLRGHNIRVKSVLVFNKQCSTFEDSFNTLNLSRFQNTRVYQLASWEKFEGRFEGDYFFLSPSSITFQPVARYGNPYMVMLSIFESARQLYRLLEEDNPGLRIEEDYTFVLGQEYAFERDTFALACVKLGETFRNARFGIDDSFGPELEFWDKAQAVENATKWKNHTEEFVADVIDDRIRVADLRRVPEIASRLSDIEGKALPLLERSIENNVWFERNMEEHREILASIRAGLGELQAAKSGNTNQVSKSTNLVVDDKKEPSLGKVVSTKSVFDMSPAELREFWAARRGKNGY